jgi:hypothetical protein
MYRPLSLSYNEACLFNDFANADNFFSKIWMIRGQRHAYLFFPIRYITNSNSPFFLQASIFNEIEVNFSIERNRAFQPIEGNTKTV